MANTSIHYHMDEYKFISELDAEEIIDVNVYMDVTQDNDIATRFFELLIWCECAYCPDCLSDNVYKMTPVGVKHLWRCKSCCRQFNIKTNSMFEHSRVKLKHWAYAFSEACFYEKGATASSVHKYTGVSYKSSLDMVKKMEEKAGVVIINHKLMDAYQKLLTYM